MSDGARFPECKTCVNFKPTKISLTCYRCGAGEFYEEKIRDLTEYPNDSEYPKFINNFRKMFPDE